MSLIKNLIAQQKQAASQQKPAPPKAESTSQSLVVPKPASPATVPQQTVASQPTQAAPAAPASSSGVRLGKPGLGLRLGAPAAPQPKVDAPKATPVTKPASQETQLPATLPEPQAVPEFEIEYEDRIPATAVQRKLPTEGLSDAQQSFLESLDSLYRIFNDPEALGAACVGIMIELQQNPDYEQMLADQDVRQLLIAARESMGVAKIKKFESKAKRGGGSKKAALTEADAMKALFGDLGDLG